MTESKNRLLSSFLHFLHDRFNLESDKADELETIEYIRKGVEFRGTNLWVLIFAIFIASIGLNVNSTAVIIGAMLISPLMGPVLGIGTSVAINDLDMLKKSIKNLSIATVISVVTSTVYFSISPLNEAQSELLARTTPTIWDVLIALFGGLAGIVASSRKEKSNVIPGVAIATALMPPLCTAGFGLATGNFYYFIGAFYLYFINSVFISLATVLIVRFLKYPRKEFVDVVAGRRVRTIIITAVIVTVVPSIYLTYRVVQRSIFEHNASRFVNQELQFEKTRIINRSYLFDAQPSRIEIALYGDQVDGLLIAQAEKKLAHYGLTGCQLVIFQRDTEIDPSLSIENMRASIIEEIYKQNLESIKSKDEQIKLLESELFMQRQAGSLTPTISNEMKALYPTLKEFSLEHSVVMKFDSLRTDTVYLAITRFSQRPTRAELRKIKNWLSQRIQNDVEIVLR